MKALLYKYDVVVLLAPTQKSWNLTSLFQCSFRCVMYTASIISGNERLSITGSGASWSQYCKYAELLGTLNSLAPGKFEWNLRYVIFKQILVIDGWGISCEIALIWMSLYFTDDQSTLVQVMAWCRQATSHYLNQCWPISLSPYGVTRPQWVNSLWPSEAIWCHKSGSTLAQVITWTWLYFIVVSLRLCDTHICNS